jgi:hypothetical protein
MEQSNDLFFRTTSRDGDVILSVFQNSKMTISFGRHEDNPNFTAVSVQNLHGKERSKTKSEIDDILQYCLKNCINPNMEI